MSNWITFKSLHSFVPFTSFQTFQRVYHLMMKRGKEKWGDGKKGKTGVKKCGEKRGEILTFCISYFIFSFCISFWKSLHFVFHILYFHFVFHFVFHILHFHILYFEILTFCISEREKKGKLATLWRISGNVSQILFQKERSSNRKTERLKNRVN